MRASHNPDAKEVVVRGRVVWTGYELGYLCSCGRCYPVPGMFNRSPLPELCHACGTLRKDMQKRALGVAKVTKGWLWWRTVYYAFSSGLLIDPRYPMPYRRQAKRSHAFENVVPIRAQEARNS